MRREKLTFDEYWSSSAFLDKRPIRNGSQKMMVGDNIYYCDTECGEWHQADSHHSHADGSINLHNLTRDTQSNNVLISQHFFYFGKEPPTVPKNLLDLIGYKNSRGYRVFEDTDAGGLIEWLQNSFRESLNQLIGDPFDFDESQSCVKHVDVLQYKFSDVPMTAKSSM